MTDRLRGLQEAQQALEMEQYVSSFRTAFERAIRIMRNDQSKIDPESLETLQIVIGCLANDPLREKKRFR